MGFKLVYYIIIITTATFVILNKAPNLLDIEPQSYSLMKWKFEGALAANKELDKGQIIMKGEALAPESLAANEDGIYAALEDGRIVLIQNDAIIKTIADTSKNSPVSGRPLGLRFYKGDLFVADIKRGLLKVDVKSGKVTVLLSSSDILEGKKVNLLNDLDIDDQGVIYVSDMSTKWQMENYGFSVLEHGSTGRVYRYDTKTGQATVLLKDLCFPNGVQLTHDRNALLVSDVTNNRVLMHHLAGDLKGKSEVFADLPGAPDNIRTSSSGGYWIPLVGTRDSSSFSVEDWLSSYPKIRKAVAKLVHASGSGLEWVNQYISSPLLTTISNSLKRGELFLALLFTDNPMVVELDAVGNIVRSLQSKDPAFGGLSQGLEYNGHLYLGSYRNPYIVKLKL